MSVVDRHHDPGIDPVLEVRRHAASCSRTVLLERHLDRTFVRRPRSRTMSSGANAADRDVGPALQRVDVDVVSVADVGLEVVPPDAGRILVGDEEGRGTDRRSRPARPRPRARSASTSAASSRVGDIGTIREQPDRTKRGDTVDRGSRRSPSAAGPRRTQRWRLLSVAGRRSGWRRCSGSRRSRPRSRQQPVHPTTTAAAQGAPRRDVGITPRTRPAHPRAARASDASPRRWPLRPVRRSW